MKAYIITTLIGVFAVDEKNKILGFVPFPKDPKEMAKKYKEAEFGIIDEEKKLQTKLWKKGYKEFIYPINKPGVKHVEVSKPLDYIKSNLRQLAIRQKIVKNEAEFNQLFLKFNLELTKVKIKLSTKKDFLIIQAERALEDMDKILNIFSERLREWYGLHFPELNKVVSSHEKFAKIVAKFGGREHVDDPELNELKKSSIGMDITERDEKILKEFARTVAELYVLREKIAKYIEKTLRELAPNFTEIATPLLAAKLLSKAGSLEKLARMPSSTIQLLGAEKALFRYLHGKGKPPRHGIIFSHPYLQKVKDKDRGKVARVLASKLSMAARIDFYSKEDRSKKLKKELEERIEEILKGRKHE